MCHAGEQTMPFVSANVLVLQSGGPTAVINQTLSGVVTAAGDYPDRIDRVFGAHHGLHGLLHENLVDLTSVPSRHWQAIAGSPGAALGSARLKPLESDLGRVFEVLAVHKIRYLFYTGGNDSAEAAQLIREYAEHYRADVRILHLPKTIDNDLMVTDHCPGYGSVARVVTHLIAGDDLDNRSFYNGVKINVCMGRHAGWIAAATSLAKLCRETDVRPEDAAPHLIYLPEVRFEESRFLDDVQRVYDRLGRVTIVVAEGLADQIQDRRFEGEADEFGNRQLSGSGRLGDYLCDLVRTNLRTDRSLGSLRVRADTWGYLQRSLTGLISPVDAREAYHIGRAGVHYMMQGETDQMVTLRRTMASPYQVETGLCDLSLVAQKTRKVPATMIDSSGTAMTQAFFDYAAPLVGELPHVHLLQAERIAQKLPEYVRRLPEKPGVISG
jgi:6-phosphofructokinase 1